MSDEPRDLMAALRASIDEARERRLINRVPGFENVEAPAVPTRDEIMTERQIEMMHASTPHLDGQCGDLCPGRHLNGSSDFNPSMFPANYKSRMIAAYPIIAGMDADEFYYGDTDDREQAFTRILAAKNLRRTHEQFLSGGRS